MRKLRIAVAGILFTFFSADLALAGVAAPCPSSVCYTEVGDAGDRFDPQSITGGPYQFISGDIGGPTPPPKDRFDAFKFFFGGGLLSAFITAAVPIELRLFTELLVEIAPIVDTAFSENWGVVSAGNYILEVEALNDPPFFIDFFGPTPNPILPPIPVAPAPEPGIAALLLLGLTFLAMRRRRAG